MFDSREDAGRKLGRFLKENGVRADIVLGLPRGGVIVAAEAAKILDLPLDVLVVRKIGHPRNREFAVGALAEGGIVILDDEVIGRNRVRQADLDEVIDQEKHLLRTYEQKFHKASFAVLDGLSALIVDDGLATGATAEAAVVSARRQRARRVMIAAPVASVGALERLRGVADDVLALLVDPGFDAVGAYYDRFSQTTDEEVIELLAAA